MIERLAVGVYDVTLKSLVPDNLSIATVTAFGNTDRYASIGRWGDDGCNGTTVRVHTFDPAGNLADERFVLRYLTNRRQSRRPWRGRTLCRWARVPASPRA